MHYVATLGEWYHYVAALQAKVGRKKILKISGEGNQEQYIYRPKRKGKNQENGRKTRTSSPRQLLGSLILT